MELALHHPEHGYYARGPQRIGPRGDFFTASRVGPAFGACIARQLLDLDREAGPFSPFDVIEFAGGAGDLARAILDAVRGTDPAAASRLRYTIVERSAGMRDAARARVPEARVVAPAEAPSGLRGCALAVELFDALPVHRLRRKDGRLVELYVDDDGAGALVVREGRPTAAALALAERYGAAAEEGTEAEVAPALEDEMRRLAGTLDRGVVLVFDYGDRASALYGPGRERGTLLAYHRHATNEDYLLRVGEQDLTAHVNFTALGDAAGALGLEPLGTVTQERFLVRNGILAEFDAPTAASYHDPRQVRRRLQALQLVHPGGMGRIFSALGFAKNLHPAPRLAGFSQD